MRHPEEEGDLPNFDNGIQNVFLLQVAAITTPWG